MKHTHKVIGFHVRHETVGKEIKQTLFRHGEYITPTTLELKMFVNKFVPVVEFAKEVVDDVENTILMDVINKAKELLESEDYDLEDKDRKALEGYVKKNPTTQDKVDKLVVAIEKILKAYVEDEMDDSIPEETDETPKEDEESGEE